MRFYLLSDNTDTLMGMRLTGIEGVVVHTPEEVGSALDEAMAMEDVGVVLITEKAFMQCEEKVMGYKLTRAQPLIVEIPDRHATANITDTISKYLSEAVGIKL